MTRALTLGLDAAGGPTCSPAATASRSPARAPAPPPVTVPRVPACRRPSTEWDEYTGRFTRARIGRGPRQGFRIHRFDPFQRRPDGQAGGPPVRPSIPRPYRLAVEQAKADVERAQGPSSRIALARRATRNAPWPRTQALTERELDTRKSNRARCRGQVASAEAAVKQGRAQSRMDRGQGARSAGASPTSGSDAGKPSSPGGQTGATLLTVIVSIDPIHFVFDGSEGRLSALCAPGRGRRAALLARRAEPGLGAARRRDRIQASGPHGLRRHTCSIPRPAPSGAAPLFDNKDGLLTGLPGSSGGCACSAASTAALLVPDAAIASDQASKIVFHRRRRRQPSAPS